MENISFDGIKELFIKYKYLPTDDLIWRAYIGLMQSVGRRHIGQDVYAICLDGPAGAGKSSFAKVYSKILEEITGEKIEFLTYSCNIKTGKEEIFEDIKLSAAITHEADNLIVPGFIAQATKLCNEGKKVVLRVDEYDKAKPEIDSYMLEFLQEGRISTSQSGEVKLKHPENLQVILCKNDNRAQLSAPLTRRLNFITLDYTTPNDMASIVGINMKEQSNAIKLLVLMMYTNIYKDKDDYTRIPSASEVMIAIDEADILTKGGAPKQYIYKNIINNLFKSAVDISTYTSGNQKKGNLNEEIENMKMVFNSDADEPFDNQALTLDLYQMYFKPLMDDLREEMKMELNEICSETNEFESPTDYRLIQVEVGKKSQSKFELSDSWFMLGEIKTDVTAANTLADKADDIRYDGPIFVVEDYYITVVKENLDNNVSLKFLSNKPAIPTGVVIKLKELIQYIDSEEFNFSFPLVSQYKFDDFSEKQRGFYEYETSIAKQCLKEVFEDIVEVKLNEVKMKTGKIIEGKDIEVKNFGKGNKAILKTASKSLKENIQRDVIEDNSISLVQKIIPIPFVNPILIDKGKTTTVSYNSDTKISKIEIRSKKKGTTYVDAFEPEKIVEDLNSKNYKEAEDLNESLLSDYQTKRKYHILRSLDSSQKKYLSNFIDEEKVDPLNINEAVSNCVDYCIANDVLNEERYSLYDNTRTIYDTLSPDIKTFALRMRRYNKRNN